MKEIRERLTFLSDVGVGYLQLDRAAKTLSGGEAQRLRLATQIGSQLVGVLYILDEPSIGLHQRDNDRLIGTLQRLKALGNTVLVVEHDEQMMRVADWVVDMGPGAGEHGGQVVAEGTAKQVMRTKGSVTGDFLSGRRTIAIPPRREDDRGVFTVRGAAQHNLKGIDVEFPVGKFICVTGVSGSGKSTLVNEIVYKALANRLNKVRIKPGEHDDVEGIEVFDKVIDIDQTPIGRTPRSNPATYTDLFTHVRELYSLTPEAKVRGYKPGRFSFNVRGGRCETCKGDGQIKIEMHFLPDVYVPCETCHGKRYNKETLEVRFKGKSISDVLEMSVEEALDFFARIPKIHRRLQTLHDVGLDYIRLGQPATTLSGGEAQRVKLASELSKVATGRTLYILDEPTTGLHFADIEKLLEVLQRLVDTGNTVLVIEHNLDVIKQADWVVDLGPEGGEAGGELIATGTPEEIAAVEESYTGQFLRGVLAEPAKRAVACGLRAAVTRAALRSRGEREASEAGRDRRRRGAQRLRRGPGARPALVAARAAPPDAARREVFVALRDDDEVDVDARSEPILAIVIVAGMAGILLTPAWGTLLDDESLDWIVLAVVTFIGGLFYGAAGYFLLGLVVWLGARGVGLETRGRQGAAARRVRGASVRALDRRHGARDPARVRHGLVQDGRIGRRHRACRRRLASGLALALWSLGLLALGLRTTFELPWRGVVGALALAAVIVAAFAVRALDVLSVRPCRGPGSPPGACRPSSSASKASSSSAGIP